MAIRFDGRVAIVTGAGGGLGRSHALEFARRGAKVVVNDLGGSVDGSGGSSDAANAVVEEIKAAGGEAIANGSSVTDRDGVARLVAEAMDAFGRIDILVNNAGILRDKSFAKMSMDDFQLVVDVHLMGAANCAHAVWPVMKQQKYGRIVMTASSSGLYGNFGQTNYGAAKLGQAGLMNTLKLEGAKDNIHTNAIVPIAATRMTEDLFPPQLLELFRPELVSPAVMLLAGEDAPNGEIICAGAGHFAKAQIVESEGAYLGAEATAETLAARWDDIVDMRGQQPFEMGAKQTEKFAMKAMAALKKG
ncbi:3-oxoacyl-ACP reductase [Iodidimonas gelatinilytica]|uniref:3-oxoacyl-ACP reductase n=1 Tax=Iodidimonas gelatinilytica TaxID=1236966 RepID=A0A5A7MXY7_9PROT|nr:SDR family oxidoreductase [Iodidimonas gelatinilytica]GEQ98013.1 3-oxoacyl-ACP reductase [Iodidimonas gelatinilytica]GEQ99869.1 3-oxoacyl-ACP reductase [Iodidimonas gelatinilytica]